MLDSSDSRTVPSPSRRGAGQNDGLSAKQRERVIDASELYRGVIRKAYQGKASPRSAIKAFCLQCVGYVRKDVTDCTAEACPLYAYRPYQQGEDVES